MRWLKQTTSADVPIGPFLDATDGVTALTGLTLTQPDIRLKKNAAAWAQKAAAQTLSHEENGFYEVTLDATDTGTLGLLRLAVFESGALPVWEDFLVVPANIYDSIVLGSDLLDTSLVQIAGTAQSATDLKDFADTGYDPSSHKVTGVVLADTVTTYTGNTPQTGDAYARIGATGSGLTSLASAANLAVVAGYVDTEIAAIKAKTDEIPADIDGLTLTELLRVIGAVLIGKASGLDTTTAIFRAIDDSKDRVEATVDADGNRSAVTIDETV